ncbi:hypothetical protein HS125_13750 [bacterium]|nr:hypothetical protein [bacterium]
MARRKGLEEFIPDLARIHASGEHLLRLINDILDLSKVEAGRLELSPEIFSLATLLSDVAATVEPLAARNANRFQLDVPDQPGEIYADPTRLRQILLNLLGNACKFTEAGVITLHARRSLCDGRPGVLVQVRDTGIGMTPEELARVFEPFVQADGSTTRKYGGTGLGLSIAKRLCESMGGRLSAESAPQAGTCFTLWLPAAAEEGTVVAALPAAP